MRAARRAPRRRKRSSRRAHRDGERVLVLDGGRDRARACSSTTLDGTLDAATTELSGGASAPGAVRASAGGHRGRRGPASTSATRAAAGPRLRRRRRVHRHGPAGYRSACRRARAGRAAAARRQPRAPAPFARLDVPRTAAAGQPVAGPVRAPRRPRRPTGWPPCEPRRPSCPTARSSGSRAGHRRRGARPAAAPRRRARRRSRRLDRGCAERPRARLRRRPTRRSSGSPRSSRPAAPAEPGARARCASPPASAPGWSACRRSTRATRRARASSAGCSPRWPPRWRSRSSASTTCRCCSTPAPPRRARRAVAGLARRLARLPARRRGRPRRRRDAVAGGVRGGGAARHGGRACARRSELALGVPDLGQRAGRACRRLAARRQRPAWASTRRSPPPRRRARCSARPPTLDRLAPDLRRGLRRAALRRPRAPLLRRRLRRATWPRPAHARALERLVERERPAHRAPTSAWSSRGRGSASRRGSASTRSSRATRRRRLGQCRARRSGDGGGRGPRATLCGETRVDGEEDRDAGRDARQPGGPRRVRAQPLLLRQAARRPPPGDGAALPQREALARSTGSGSAPASCAGSTSTRATGIGCIVGPAWRSTAAGARSSSPHRFVVEDPLALTDDCGPPTGEQRGRARSRSAWPSTSATSSPTPVLVADCDVREECGPGAVRERFRVLVHDGAARSRRAALERASALGGGARARPPSGGDARRPDGRMAVFEPPRDAGVDGTARRPPAPRASRINVYRALCERSSMAAARRSRSACRSAVGAAGRRRLRRSAPRAAGSASRSTATWCCST